MKCQETIREAGRDQRCGGELIREVEGDWVYFSCDACGTVRSGHVSKLDREAQRAARLERAGLPDAFIGLRFEETADNREALKHLRLWLTSYWQKPLPAPALCGEPGRGKTHLLTAICTRLIKQHDAAVLFHSTTRLLRQLQQFEDRAGIRDLLHRASTIEVLVLDDLGAERVTDWRREEIANLIDIRYQAKLPTLLATNYAPEDWELAVEERAASRLRGMTFPLELRGPDRRQQPLKPEVLV